MQKYFFILFSLFFLLVSCNKKTDDITTLAVSESYLKGEAIYKGICVACHNRDPHKPGNLGPDVAGSNLALIRSMIMTGDPPIGVDSKWPDMKMVPLPHLESQIPHIYEYLKTFE